MKKAYSHICLISILIILLVGSSSLVSARLLAGKSRGEEVEFKNGMGEVSTTLEPQNDDTFDMLLGLEKCEKGDKECFKRRVLEEVHLDYIYTQHHKP